MGTQAYGYGDLPLDEEDDGVEVELSNCLNRLEKKMEKASRPHGEGEEQKEKFASS